MRIERIELDGFGRFHDDRWPFHEGLTVLLGANEAGKTTLLNALRALLFGFEASRDGRAWYPALGGGRRGGRLSLRTAAGERWIVERHGERGGGGALAVRAPNGNQGGQETLDRLLHGADKDLYTNIFAFGLGELQTFSSLSAEGVRGRIYGAGAGLGGTSALDLERRLRQQMDAAFVPGGSKRPLNALLAQIEELRGEIADLSHQPEEHVAAHREREELSTRSQALRDEAGALRDALGRHRRLRDARSSAIELTELEVQLADGDATLDELPDDAVAILDRLEAEAGETAAVLATLGDDLEETRQARTALAVDLGLLAQADEIDVIVADLERLGAGAGRRRDLAAAADRQHATVTELLERVGGWEEAALVALDDSIPTVEATREHESRLGSARGTHGAAEQRRRAVADELEALGPNPAADTAAGDDLDARLAALRELDTPSRPGEPSPARGSDRPWLAALALACAAAALLLGAVASAPVAGAAAAALLGVGAYVIARGSRRRRSGEMSDVRTAELLRRAGLAPDAGAAEVAAVRDELVAARARRDLAGEARDRMAARWVELQRREGEVASAEEELVAAQAAWAGWLSERGLPPGISPDAARQLLAAAGTARRAAVERDHHRRELDAIAADEAAVSARADALLDRIEAPAGDRAVRVAALAARLEEARAADRRARDLDARIAQLERRCGPVRASLEERRATLDTHVRACGCADPDELRRRSRAALARRELRGAIRERRSQLALIAGPDGTDELVREAIRTDPDGLAATDAQMRAALERLEAEEREATTRIGALEARIAALEAAEEIGARRQELAVLEGRAAAMARDWAVRAVALRLLEETRARYERERQPDVVRAAEAHFERITDGRYPRIVAPPGDASVRVETEGGESRSTDELSRGTAEQLYLALRFGLIEEFARHAEPLPVVMDDILVNFDVQRAARAASAVRELAERHQVLYFTCHPWTAEVLDPGGTRTITLG